MKTTRLPVFLKKYFWDVDFQKLDPGKNNQYMIVRLLEHGDETAIKWLYRKYPSGLIKKVVTTNRGLSPKTASFWALLLDIDKRKVVCLQTPYLKMRQAHWPY